MRHAEYVMMVDDRKKRRLLDCCMTQSRHKIPRVERRRTASGMVILVRWMSSASGILHGSGTNRPSYNAKAAKNPAYCTKHAGDGMVCVPKPRRVFM